MMIHRTGVPPAIREICVKESHNLGLNIMLQFTNVVFFNFVTLIINILRMRSMSV